MIITPLLHCAAFKLQRSDDHHWSAEDQVKTKLDFFLSDALMSCFSIYRWSSISWCCYHNASWLRWFFRLKASVFTHTAVIVMADQRILLQKPDDLLLTGRFSLSARGDVQWNSLNVECNYSGAWCSSTSSSPLSRLHLNQLKLIWASILMDAVSVCTSDVFYLYTDVCADVHRTSSCSDVALNSF